VLVGAPAEELGVVADVEPGMLLDGLVEPFFFFLFLSIDELPVVEVVVEALRPASLALVALEVVGNVGGVVVGVVAEGKVEDEAGGMVGFTAPGAVDCRPGAVGVPGMTGAPGAALGAAPGAAGTWAAEAPARARALESAVVRIRPCIRMGFGSCFCERLSSCNCQAPHKSSPGRQADAHCALTNCFERPYPPGWYVRSTWPASWSG
jgi:hypothetical protein